MAENILLCHELLDPADSYGYGYGDLQIQSSNANDIHLHHCHLSAYSTDYPSLNNNFQPISGYGDLHHCRVNISADNAVDHNPDLQYIDHESADQDISLMQKQRICAYQRNRASAEMINSDANYDTDQRLIGDNDCVIIESDHHDLSCTNEAAADSVELLDLLLERQQRPHCRPLRAYAEYMVRHCAAGDGDQMIIKKKLKRDYGGIRANYERINLNPWEAMRRSCVEWILQAANMMHVRLATAVQAVAYLDRYLANRIQVHDDVESEDMSCHVVAAACFWIALKFDDVATPGATCMQRLGDILMGPCIGQYIHYISHPTGGQSKDATSPSSDQVTLIKAMEARILKALNWHLMSVTYADFVDSILETNFELSNDTTKQLVSTRAHEILQGVLLEVTFARYEASTVGICVIHHTLEELLPLKTFKIMTSIQNMVSCNIDMDQIEECYKAIGDLVVDPLNSHSSFNGSPDRVLSSTMMT